MIERESDNFWNSRIRLACISGSLLFLTLTLDQLRVYVEDSGSVRYRIGNSAESAHGNTGESFTDDVDYVLETMQYMYDLRLGKAEIRPVVEESRKVRQYWWRCHLKKPTTVVISDWFQNDDLYVYSATYDRRRNSLYPNNHVIQVLTMSFRSIPSENKIFCNLYDMVRERYAVTEGRIREIWQRAWDPRDFFYIPNLISCPVPKYFEYSTNLTVSLSKIACKSQKNAVQVRISTSGKEKGGIAGLDYLEDIPERLVEWFEMQFITGADTITVYTYHVPHKMQQVLNYYSKQGSITVVPFYNFKCCQSEIPINLPGESPNQAYIRSRFIWRNRQQKRRHELIPYNDCLYRHIDTHKFILILDIDEVIVPLKHDNWSAMLNDIITTLHQNQKNEITSISIRNVFKFPSSTNSSNPLVPSYMYMLQNRQKSKTLSKPGEYGKAFINTNTVATVFNHFALHRHHGDVAGTLHAEPSVAIKLHYKTKCPTESRKECEQLEHITMDDTTMDRFAKKLTKQRYELKFFYDSESIHQDVTDDEHFWELLERRREREKRSMSAWILGMGMELGSREPGALEWSVGLVSFSCGY
uniref:Glycosyltransferase family 92 protein n=1 Tax=Setaria digitata TaxID=48799 RepID=A0A915PZD7_9BILA